MSEPTTTDGMEADDRSGCLGLLTVCIVVVLALAFLFGYKCC